MKPDNSAAYWGVAILVASCTLTFGIVNVPVSATAEVTEFTPSVANDTATEENITIQGQITRPDGNPAANEFVLVFIGYGEANSGFDDPKTDTNGEFSISVPADKETVLAFEQAAFDRDGVPDLYTLASVNSSSDIDLGETALPAAHVLNVTVINSTSAPVKNASVDIGHRNDGRRIGTIVETNEEGQFEIGSSPPGYEVVGDVSVRVTPPDSNQVVAERSLTVTEDRDITIKIEEDATEANPFPNGVPGVGSDPPTDPDGDGLYEDVNGDGTADFDDAIALAFAQTDTLTQDQIAQTNTLTQDRIDALDFDGDGDVDFDDAIELAFSI